MVYASEAINDNTIFKDICLGDQQGQRELSAFWSHCIPKYPFIRIYSAVSFSALWLLCKKKGENAEKFETGKISTV